MLGLGLLWTSTLSPFPRPVGHAVWRGPLPREQRPQHPTPVPCESGAGRGRQISVAWFPSGGSLHFSVWPVGGEGRFSSTAMRDAAPPDSGSSSHSAALAGEAHVGARPRQQPAPDTEPNRPKPTHGRAARAGGLDRGRIPPTLAASDRPPHTRDGWLFLIVKLWTFKKPID